MISATAWLRADQLGPGEDEGAFAAFVPDHVAFPTNHFQAFGGRNVQLYEHVIGLVEFGPGIQVADARGNLGHGAIDD